ncbi:hypothetical protein HOE04_02435 [archaeon]|jgi:hypothetical protein|nr:hypothetical protein [archaeon]
MILDFISNYIQSIFDSVPEDYKVLISLLLYTIFIALYAIFIWKFYKFLASKEIIQLNLKQYNYSNHPGLEKFFAIGLYTVEYLVILPFLVLFWFAILSLFLLLLSEQGAEQVLLVSAAIIASTRITAYVSEDLSKDLAKILPFTVLATFILGENFFDVSNLIAKIVEIPALFNNILMFIVFIFIVEFVLRGFYSIGQFFNSEDNVGES